MPEATDKKLPGPPEDDERKSAVVKPAGAVNAGGPTRPPLRSNFDLEPNPFEQSFSRGSETSSSSIVTQSTLKNGRASPTATSPTNNGQNAKPPGLGETPKPMLPPLASLASPSDNTYAWGLNSADLAGSLRSGPLSPAMLQGPQQNSASNHHPTSGLSLGSFDHANFGRTGLTPSTGLTPLVGGPVSFPPPSPNTAAFLAMVTNSTTAAALASSTAATITPNTLSTITGVLNTSMPQTFDQRGNSYQGFTTARPEAYTASSSSDNQVNGLFLLSQAHQELAKREEAQRAGSISGLSDVTANGASAAAPKRGAKRKSVDTSPTAAAGPTTRNAGKKTKTAAPPRPRKGGRRVDSGDDDDDLDDDSDADIDLGPPSAGANKSKKPETEEEKRRNFLERNRQAALKCRQRKKQWLAQLQAKVEFLGQENERLQNALMASREEIQRLTALVGGGAMNIQQNGPPNMSAPPVAVAVSLSSKPGVASDVTRASSGHLQQSAVVGGGRSYGY